MALLTGLGAGLLFLAIAVIGSAIFKAEALGFGDVKMAVFIGLVLGLRPAVNAILTGIVLAGLVAIGTSGVPAGKRPQPLRVRPLPGGRHADRALPAGEPIRAPNH